MGTFQQRATGRDPVCGLMVQHKVATSSQRSPRQLKGSQGGLATSQDFSKRGGAMVKVRHEPKVLSTGQLCAQGIGWNLSFSQSCQVEVLVRIPTQKTLCRPGTSLLPLPERPDGQRDPWWLYLELHSAQSSLSLNDAHPSSLLSPLQYFSCTPPLSIALL